jgi:hypothetical protein
MGVQPHPLDARQAGEPRRRHHATHGFVGDWSRCRARHSAPEHSDLPAARISPCDLRQQVMVSLTRKPSPINHITELMFASAVACLAPPPTHRPNHETRSPAWICTWIARAAGCGTRGRRVSRWRLGFDWAGWCCPSDSSKRWSDRRAKMRRPPASSNSWRWPSSSCRAPTTDTFARCAPNTAVAVSNSSPRSPDHHGKHGGRDAGGSARDVRACRGRRERLGRRLAWRRLGVEGLDLYRHPETGSERTGLVIGYVSPVPSAWSALDALIGLLPDSANWPLVGAPKWPTIRELRQLAWIA